MSLNRDSEDEKREEKLERHISELDRIYSYVDAISELLTDNPKLLAIKKQLQQLKVDTTIGTSEFAIKLTLMIDAFSSVVVSSLEKIKIDYDVEINEKINLLNGFHILLTQLENTEDKDKDIIEKISRLKESMKDLRNEIIALNKKTETVLNAIVTSISLSSELGKLQKELNAALDIREEVNDEVVEMIEVRDQCLEDFAADLVDPSLPDEQKKDEKKKIIELEKTIWNEQIQTELAALKKAKDDVKRAGEQFIDDNNRFKALAKNEKSEQKEDEPSQISVQDVLIKLSDKDYEAHKTDINVRLLIVYQEAIDNYVNQGAEQAEIDNKFGKLFKEKFGVDCYHFENGQLIFDEENLKKVAKEFSTAEIISLYNSVLILCHNEKSFFTNKSRAEDGFVEAVKELQNNDRFFKDNLAYTRASSGLVELKVSYKYLAPPKIESVEKASNFFDIFKAAYFNYVSSVKELASKINIYKAAADSYRRAEEKIIQFYKEHKEIWKSKEMKPDSDSKKVIVDQMNNKQIIDQFAKYVSDVKNELINDAKGISQSCNVNTYASFFAPTNNTAYIVLLNGLSEGITKNNTSYQAIMAKLDTAIIDATESKNKHIQEVLLALKLNMQNFEGELKLKNKGFDRACSELQVRPPMSRLS